MPIGERAKKMCRACLSTNEKQSKLIPLFSGGCAASEVPKKIANICNISVYKEDSLPDTICQKCVFLVKVTYNFIRQLQAADSELRRNFYQGTNTEGSSVNARAATKCSDADIEELAYNPEFISETVKEEVEEAFRKKHNLGIRDLNGMSQVLQNSDKNHSGSSNENKEEILTAGTINKLNKASIADTDKSASFQYDSLFKEKSDKSSENKLTELATSSNDAIPKTADAMITSYPEDSKNLSLYLSELLKSKESVASDKRESAKEYHENHTLEANIGKEKSNSKVILISDMSDEENTKVKENASSTRPMSLLNDTEKKKLETDSSLQTGVLPGKQRIQVKKIFQTVRSSCSLRKVQSKKLPRTYFLCTTCNVRLQSVAAVLLHHNEVHSPNQNSLQCRMCDKAFPSKFQLLAHFDQHVETHLFRCSHCPNEFVLKDNLKRHMLNHGKPKLLEPTSKRTKMSNNDGSEETKAEAPKNGFVRSAENKENNIADTL